MLSHRADRHTLSGSCIHMVRPQAQGKSSQYYAAAAAKCTKRTFFLLASLKSPAGAVGLWPNCAVAEQELKPRHAPHARLDRLLKRGIIGSVLHLKLLKILEPHLRSIGRSRIWSLT